MSAVGNIYPKAQILQGIHLDMDKRSSLPPNKRLLSETPISIYALDLAIVTKIDHIIKFVIQFYQDSTKGKAAFNTPTGKWKLTPLHLAVIYEDLETAKNLLSAGADPNPKDLRQWTPLHHAALRNHQAMIAVLLDSGADTKSMTESGGTFEDIKVLAHNPVVRVQSPWIPFVQLRDYVTSPEAIAKDWSQGVRVEPSHILGFMEEIREPYEQFRTKPLKRHIKPVHVDSSERRLSFSPGLGVFVGTDVKCQAVVGEYLGVITKQQTGGYVFSYRDGQVISAEKKGSFSSRINTSFPNTGALLLTNSHQMYTRKVFVALESIKSGQQLCWNYGFHGLKMGPYIELRPSEMRAFIKSVDLQHCFRSLFQQLTVGDRDFASFVVAEKFRYILQTPSAVFSMILDGTITPDVGKHLVGYAIVTGLVPSEVSDSYRQTADIAATCASTYRAFKQIDPDTAEEFLKYLLMLPERVQFSETLDLSQYTANFIQQKLSSDIYRSLGRSRGGLKSFWADMEKKLNAIIKEKYK